MPSLARPNFQIVAILIALLAACDSTAGPGEGVACDTMAVISVSVTVATASGAALPDPTVTYTVDGGARETCTSLSATTFGCGAELAGEFLVMVTAEGYTTVTQSVTVAEGECHPTPEALDFELEPRCDSVRHAAIVVEMSASTGEDLLDPVVETRSGNTDAAPRVGCDENQGRWFCNWDESGSFTVYGVATGWAELESAVEVPLDSDGCHPEMQTGGV